MKSQAISPLSALLRDRSPVATAWIEADDASMRGTIRFFRTPIGTVVSAELLGPLAPLKDLSFSVRRGNRLATADLAPLSRDDPSTFVGITHHLAIEDLLGKTVAIRAATDTASTLSACGPVHRVGVAQNA